MNKKIFQIIGPFVLICISVILLYGSFQWNPIVFDDLPFFVTDSGSDQPVSTMHFEWLQLRSLPYATLAWTKSAFGLELIYFRLGNLALHAAVCCALYAFLRALYTAQYSNIEITQNPSVGSSRLSPSIMALVGALLFALHPVATYAVGYLVQRTTLFATLFCLLALWAWVHGCVTRQLRWQWLSVPLYYLAVFSKEHAIMLLAALPLLTVVLHADWRVRLRQQAAILLAMLIIAAIAVLARKGILGSAYEPNASEMLALTDAKLAYPLSILTQTAMFFKYGLLWLFPRLGGMSIDLHEAFASLQSPIYWITAIAYLGWGAAGAWLVSKRGDLVLLGFALLFPWLMFMTEFSTVRIQEIFVLYRSYLWVVGALCALPLVLGRLNKRTAIAVCAVCAAMLFLFSMERLATMSHPILLWEDAKKVLAGRNELPGASRIYFNLGSAYNRAEMPAKGIPELLQAAELAPGYAATFSKLGTAYAMQSEWVKAVQSFSRAMDINDIAGKPQRVGDLLERASAYENMGEFERSQLDYRESCRMAKQGCDKLR
jgi:tetratricopeptide (TPR) repeat protein